MVFKHRPVKGTGPLRVMLFGDGPRPFEMAKELIYGIQDENPSSTTRSYRGKTMTHHYFEPVGWVGDFSLPSLANNRRCTRFGPLPYTCQMPQMLIDDAKADFPYLNIERWKKPIETWTPKKKVLNNEFLDWFKSKKVDLCLMSTYATLIPIELIRLVSGWFINFHPTRKHCMWPEFPGCTPWEDMFWSRVKEVAIAAYFIDDKFDRGQFITESEARKRVYVRCIDKKGRLLPALGLEAAPNLDKVVINKILKNPSILTKDDKMPGFTSLQQKLYLFENHMNMAEPTARLVASLARIIWHIRRIENIPPETTQLDYYQNIFPKQIIFH
jgi:hypothetical protein